VFVHPASEGILVDGTGGRDPAQLVPETFGEPQSPVGAGGNSQRSAAGQLGDPARIFGDRAAGADATDLIEGDFGKPQSAVRTGRDPVRLGAGRKPGRVFRDRAADGDPTDAIVAALGEPESAVRPGRNVGGIAVIPVVNGVIVPVPPSGSARRARSRPDALAVIVGLGIVVPLKLSVMPVVGAVSELRERCVAPEPSESTSATVSGLPLAFA